MTEIPKLVRDIIKDYLSKFYSSNLNNWRKKMLHVNLRFYSDIQYTIYREFPSNGSRKIAKVIYTITHTITTLDDIDNMYRRSKTVKLLIRSQSM
jgi:hypothetical protein